MKTFVFTKAKLYINRKQNPEPVANIGSGKLQTVGDMKSFYCWSDDVRLTKYAGKTIDSRDSVELETSDGDIVVLTGVRVEKGGAGGEYKITVERMR